jgi:hypothetical protein
MRSGSTPTLPRKLEPHFHHSNRLNTDNTVTALDKVIDAKAAFMQGAGDLVINEKY